MFRFVLIFQFIGICICGWGQQLINDFPCTQWCNNNLVVNVNGIDPESFKVDLISRKISGIIPFHTPSGYFICGPSYYHHGDFYLGITTPNGCTREGESSEFQVCRTRGQGWKSILSIDFPIIYGRIDFAFPLPKGGFLALSKYGFRDEQGRVSPFGLIRKSIHHKFRFEKLILCEDAKGENEFCLANPVFAGSFLFAGDINSGRVWVASLDGSMRLFSISLDNLLSNKYNINNNSFVVMDYQPNCDGEVIITLRRHSDNWLNENSLTNPRPDLAPNLTEGEGINLASSSSLPSKQNDQIFRSLNAEFEDSPQLYWVKLKLIGHSLDCDEIFPDGGIRFLNTFESYFKFVGHWLVLPNGKIDIIPTKANAIELLKSTQMPMRLLH